MIRLLLLILLLLSSLLTIGRAPAYYLWLLAIAVTEYPLVFAGITLILLLAGYRTGTYRLAGSIAGIAALLFFLYPAARAAIVSRSLRQQLDAAFAPAMSATVLPEQPFSFTRLFAGSGKKGMPYQSFTYSTVQGVDLTLDFYPSHIQGSRPCVIVVHGGSWSGGDSRQLPELNSYLAKAGYQVAAINYRLAPAYRHPAPVQDVAAALHYLKQRAGTLQIDTARLVLLGRSAGAQIALLAAYTLHEPGLKGVIDFYGPADMVWGYSLPSNPLIMDSRKVIRDYLGGPYESIPRQYESSSPLVFVNRQSVPTLLIHGSNDALVAFEHSKRLNQSLQQNGIPHYLLHLPWATHGFDFNLNGPGGQLSTYAVHYFLNQVTR